jgi:hypothetical protein
VGRYRFIDNAAMYSFPATSIPSGTPCAIGLLGFTNTATAGSYSSTITTYTAAPSVVDSATSPTLTILSPSQSVVISAAVDPELTFTVNAVTSSSSCNGATTTVSSSSTAVNLSRLSSTAQHPIGAQSLVITTNAANGYTVYMSGATSTMIGTASSHNFSNIAAGGASNASPQAWPSNVEAFGYTSDDATLGTGTPNRFTASGPKWAPISTTRYEIMYANAATAADTNCVGFQASSGTTTPADQYNISVRYTAVPNY